MPPRTLPQVQTLQGAVNEVIGQQQGKPATKFIYMTQDGNAPPDILVKVCTNLILSSQALKYLEEEIRGGVPYLLTIEDFVRQQGSAWGFTQPTIQKAEANALFYDSVSGLPHPRYS
jgi:hypothetical protein